MPTLHQILAIEKGTKDHARRVLTDAHQAVLKAPLLSGISRTYQPKDDDGDQLPPESTQVQVRAEEVLREVAAALVPLFDVIAVKDASNRVAAADVVMDGAVLLSDVPVSYLLFLEAQLVDLHTFVMKLPVLDPAERWAFNGDANCFAAEPVRTTRGKKVPRNHVVAEAVAPAGGNPGLPAQVQVYHEDVLAGFWTTVKFSGALPGRRVAELVARVEAVQRAVKQAREHANSVPAVDKVAGEAVLGYLFR